MSFNLKYLNDLFDHDQKVIKELSITFIQNVPGDIELLESVIQKEDFTQIRILSHKIKSSLALYQADLPRSLMESIELSVKRGQLDIAVINSHFQTARPQIYEVINQLKEMFK